MNILYSGLQRSGTNFLDVLIKKNYHVTSLNKDGNKSSPLHKHFRLYDNKEIIPESSYQNGFQILDFKSYEQIFDIIPDYYLVISKDPYSWLLSYRNWVELCRWPEVKHHYIEEYNLFYKKWLELSIQTNKIIFIKYIDLLRSPGDELYRLQMKMGLEKLCPYLVHTINKIEQSGPFTDERRTYYLEEKYLKGYTEKELIEINNIIDMNVISLLGYDKKD